MKKENLQADATRVVADAQLVNSGKSVVDQINTTSEVKTPRQKDINALVTLPMTVQASDIEGIGHTAHWPEENNGNTVICMSDDDGGIHIQLMFLRAILQCFGEEYKVLSISDCCWNAGTENEMLGIEVYTNLPKNLYEEAIKKNLYRNMPTH